jgi:hypothetical protein
MSVCIGRSGSNGVRNVNKLLRHWGEWLAHTAPSLYLQKQGWAIVTSQSIHIVCVAIVFGSAVVISARLLGLGASGRRVSELANTLVPWIYRALIVLLLTGIEQTIAEPMRQFMAPEFRWKMLLVVITVLLTVYFSRTVRARAAVWDDPATRPASARVFAVVWLGLWVGIVWCGRFIGYA